MIDLWRKWKYIFFPSDTKIQKEPIKLMGNRFRMGQFKRFNALTENSFLDSD